MTTPDNAKRVRAYVGRLVDLDSSARELVGAVPRPKQ